MSDQPVVQPAAQNPEILPNISSLTVPGSSQAIAHEILARAQTSASPAFREKVLQELAELGETPAGSAEYAQGKKYLRTLASMPIDLRAPDKADLNDTAEKLNGSVFGLDRAKERILEYVALLKRVPETNGPAFCLTGLPGTGKTAFAEAAAAALDRPFVRINLAGIVDPNELVGIERPSKEAQPGLIARAVAAAGVNNPVILIDGIDQIPQPFEPRLIENLLEIIDRGKAKSFTDRYLGIPMDLSKSVLIFSALHKEGTPNTLDDYMEVMDPMVYSERQKVRIAKDKLMPKLRAETNLSSEEFSITDDALRKIIKDYTVEAGVWNLNILLSKIYSKATLMEAKGELSEKSVTPENLAKFLPEPALHYCRIEPEDKVGVVKGTYWTHVGGGLLNIECAKFLGDGKLVMTGTCGEVFKDSVLKAASWLRSRSEHLNIPPGFFEVVDIHVDIPHGAVEGPSAGLAIAVGLASAMTSRPIRRDFAMTGGLGLSGAPITIGGVREKILGAALGGITNVIVPASNRSDVAAIPAEDLEGIKIHYVQSAEEAVDLMLCEKPKPGPFDPHNELWSEYWRQVAEKTGEEPIEGQTPEGANDAEDDLGESFDIEFDDDDWE